MDDLEPPGLVMGNEASRDLGVEGELVGRKQADDALDPEGVELVKPGVDKVQGDVAALVSGALGTIEEGREHAASLGSHGFST